MRRMSEKDIMRTSPEELSDLPADFWDDAELVIPVAKRAISLRVDEDVLEWFRSLGPRYQTRMNAVLRAFMKRSGVRATLRDIRRSEAQVAAGKSRSHTAVAKALRARLAR